MTGADVGEGFDVFFRNSQNHALLRLTDPNFGGRQTIVFQRRPLQLNFGTKLFSHLADRTGESTGTAIGHGPEQTSCVVVPRFKQSVEELFLNNWISNLHRMTELIGVGIRQFRRRKSCAVNAISASPAADRNDAVARLGITMHKSTRHHSNHAAEHKRVPDVPIIEPHPPVQCGDTHTVAVVTHPGDHLLQDASRRQAAGRYVCQIRVGHAEDIGGGDGLGPKTRPDDVSDATADSSGGTAIRLNRAGVVVGFNFEAHRVIVIKSHHA